MTPADEAALATVIATPSFKRVRPLIEALVGGDWDALDALVKRVRRELWRDFSRG